MDNNASKPTTVILIIGFILLLIVTGCEGPVGPAGSNAGGVDIQPPTLEIIQPWPLTTVWDRMTITAAVVDNVAISRVVFMINGSSVIGETVLIKTAPPYSVTVDLTPIGRGWHFISARAYDTAGNITDAPPRTIFAGFSRDLSDTTVLMSNSNNALEALWQVPDSVRTEAYWAGFTPAKACSLHAATVWVGGTFSDSAGVRISVWSGSAAPAKLEGSLIIAGSDASGSVRRHRNVLNIRGKNFRDNIFLVVEIDKRSSGDTLLVGADDGSPYWERSGYRGDAGWGKLRERFGRRDNLMMEFEFYYPAVDSSS